jgi:hypothetical protein
VEEDDHPIIVLTIILKRRTEFCIGYQVTLKTSVLERNSFASIERSISKENFDAAFILPSLASTGDNAQAVQFLKVAGARVGGSYPAKFLLRLAQEPSKVFPPVQAMF